LRHGPMPLRKVIDYAVQIAHGLAAAHDKGIVHRDLKPENLFVTKDGRVKILDFGLAKVDPSKDSSGLEATQAGGTDPGMVMGTVGYMSPEQVRGKTADHRSDIFSFGTVLYEMVTGKHTFRKPTSAETMTAILKEEPPSISQIAPTAPPGLQRVVHRCLEKSPEQRFQSASDMAFALEALSDSGTSSVAALKQESQSRWIWIVATAAAVPVVESITQLTDDGQPKKGDLLSDGSRVYFNEGQTGSWKIAQVSVTGGPTGVIGSRLIDPQIAGLAPEGSALIALVGGYSDLSETFFRRRAYPLWSIPLPAGEPRRLGTFEVTDADFFPDGRILLAKGTDSSVADKDGSNLRRLISAADSVCCLSISPDGRRIVFTMFSISSPGESSLIEIAADGTGLSTILNASQAAQPCCGSWSSDGKYLVYEASQAGRSDLWMLPMQTGIFHRLRKPSPLTAGPLSYSGALPSRDGKQIFAIGTKRRGELVHYDMQSHEFVPFLSGISAIGPTFSRDGKWVSYTAYPDHTLWRSRSDGTERLQLTYPPMEVSFPFISPDGTKVAF